MTDWLHAAHLACASGAGVLFIWRGMRMWRARSVTSRFWRRVVPDSVDTLLFVSGVALIVATGQYPFEAAWITVKLFLVLLYIGLGFVAFGAASDSRVRKSAWLFALLLFGLIGWLGRTHGGGLI